MPNGIELQGVRLPNRAERKRGAQIVFDYKTPRGRETVLASRCYESWQQYGAPREVLGANVDTVEAWRRGELTGFPCPEESEDD